MSRSMLAQVLYNLDRDSKPGIANSFSDGEQLAAMIMRFVNLM